MAGDSSTPEYRVAVLGQRPQDPAGSAAELQD